MENYRLEGEFNDICRSVISEIEDKEIEINRLLLENMKSLDKIDDLENEVSKLTNIIAQMDEEMSKLHNEINEKSKAEEQVQY